MACLQKGYLDGVMCCGPSIIGSNGSQMHKRHAQKHGCVRDLRPERTRAGPLVCKQIQSSVRILPASIQSRWHTSVAHGGYLSLRTACSREVVHMQRRMLMGWPRSAGIGDTYQQTEEENVHREYASLEVELQSGEEAKESSEHEQRAVQGQRALSQLRHHVIDELPPTWSIGQEAARTALANDSTARPSTYREKSTLTGQQLR